jgi:hypothetical protein
MRIDPITPKTAVTESISIPIKIVPIPAPPTKMKPIVSYPHTALFMFWIFFLTKIMNDIIHFFIVVEIYHSIRETGGTLSWLDKHSVWLKPGG